MKGTILLLLTTTKTTEAHRETVGLVGFTANGSNFANAGAGLFVLPLREIHKSGRFFPTGIVRVRGWENLINLF